MAVSLSNSRKQRVKAVFFAIWTAIVAVALAEQFIHYYGLVAFVDEWQFGLFGRAYPLIGFVIPAAVLASPGLVFFWRARTRSSAERLAGATIKSAVVFSRVLLGVAACFGFGALIFLIASLQVPGDPDLDQRIDLGKPVIAVPMEGPTSITGSLIYGQTAVFDQSLLFMRKSQRFAPIVPLGATSNDLQFFVELPAAVNAESLRDISTVRGILQRNALPGELVSLYRYAGFRVEPPYYVLFLDKSSVSWPQRRTALMLFLISLIFCGLMLLQWRRIKGLEKNPLLQIK